MYDLTVDYSIHSFKSAIDLTEERSDGTSEYSQANITAVIPSVITGSAAQLPIM